MEIENEITNGIENNIELEEQNKFFETTLGKAVNSALDFGLRAILPDMIEEQIIEVKDAIIQNGMKDGIKTAVNSISELGKSVSGIFTGKFENLSQVQVAIGNGGIIDTLSSVLDKAVNLAYKKGIISQQINSLIKAGKNVILNNVSSNIENEMNYQEKSVQYIEKYIDNFNEYFNNKDFDGMTREYKKIKEKLKDVIPLEETLSKARTIETLYNLIKNNENKFDLTETEMELVQKLN